MAKTKTFLSPAVFTNEIDASFLGAGIGAIGAAIIGTAPKGPAFVPVAVQTYSEFAEYFGDLDSDYMLGYAARAYLKNAGVANVVRVLGPSGRSANGSTVSPGYTAESMWGIVGITGSNGAYLHALLEITGNADLVIKDLTNDLFMVQISSSANDKSWVYATCSFMTSSQYYVSKVLNTDPTKFKTYGHYLREVYDYSLFKHGRDAAGVGQAIYSSQSYALTNFAFGYNSGSTPWIFSQLFGGSTEYNLFRVHTLGHGDSENGRFKISVKNIRKSPVPGIRDFGTFDLELRSFADTDLSPIVYESYPGVSLDPTDINYLGKRVGDRHWEYDQTKEKMVSYGNYPNISKFIRVEMTTGSFPDTALPWGFKGLEKPNYMYISASSPEEGILAANVSDILPNLPLVGTLLDKEQQAEVKSYIYWGMETKLSGSVKSRLSKFPTMTGSDSDFSLRYVSGSSPDATSGDATNGLRYLTTILQTSQKEPGDSTTHTTLEPDYAKFTVPIAFGFDGWNRTVANPLDNVTQLASVTQIGVQALRQGVDIIADPDFIDINLLAIPGIHSTKVVDYAIDAIEERADAFYVADLVDHTASSTTVSSTVTTIKGRNYNSNYAGIYYPGIKVKDDINNKIVELPSSIPAIAAIAYTDRVAYPWYAPAGLNRGGLNSDVMAFEATETIDRLKASERDSLYENRVNPIASFPGEGLAIWGQKTLQVKASALDRINVRRLLIKAKKLIASTVKYLVFEPNNPNTWTRFKQLVNPILSDIQQKNGLEAFKVVMDSTTNTPDVIDRNVMAGKIFLKPTRAAEFITLDFIVSRSGASFEE